MTTGKRLHEIDGIRGWAALMVVMFHLCWETFGVRYPEYRLPYFKFLLDGPLAVFVFFVLSGDALSNAYIRTQEQRALVKLVVKRYFRLTGPILISCLLAYICMKNRWVFSREAAAILDRPDWMGLFLTFDANFIEMVRYSLIKVYSNYSGSNSYNPFLWTMSIELFGSFFVFGTLFSLRYFTQPLRIVLVAAGYLALLGSFYALFFIGLATSILRERGAFEQVRTRLNVRWPLVALGLVVLLETVIEKYHLPKPAQLYIAMSVVIVLAVYSSNALTTFFSGGVSRFLGRLSFPLYITHFIVIVTYTSWSIKYCDALGVLDGAHSLLIVISSLLLTFVVSEGVAMVENRYLKVLDRIANSVLISGVGVVDGKKPIQEC